MSFGTSVQRLIFIYSKRQQLFIYKSVNNIFSEQRSGVRLSSASNPSIMSPLSEVKGTVTVTSAGSLAADVV